MREFMYFNYIFVVYFGSFSAGYFGVSYCHSNGAPKFFLKIFVVVNL